MMKPFHLSFVVPSLEQAKTFYTEVLGCEIGRDTGGWIDIIFFGHQITIHQENAFVSARPIDHFGPILSKSEWLRVAQRCEEKNIQLEMPRTVKDSGLPTEAGKFLIKDPAGNLLEFKYYNADSSPLTSAGKSS